jgi:putative addiction module component (TIGR02574 family)
MSIEQLTSEALGLTPEQRARLAESLWESLGDPFQSSADMSEDAALALAQERDRQIDKAEIRPVSHEEMMARLRR